jgi:hypothetical protein
MKSLSMSDPRWERYQGGYRQPFDARSLVESLRSSPHNVAAWDSVWNELHHQGTVGEASYALVAHLPSVLQCAGEPLAQPLAFAAVVEQQRCVPGNPPLPPELDDCYHTALRELLTISATTWPNTAPPELVSAFSSLLAIVSGQPILSRAYFDLGIDEAHAFLKEHIGYDPDDDRV